MLVSTVVCAHSLDRYHDLAEAVGSLLEQTHRELEIIVVIDGNQGLHDRVVADYSAQDAVKSILLKKNVGTSAARNAGINEARGDVVAFIDDDAVAERKWIENLVVTYQEYDAAAVGGRILPVWLCEKPDYLPEELYWLVGATHEGFAEEKVAEVRNTFGPNMSFKREVFERVGVFNENLGFARKGTSYIQAEEPELALRMKQELGKGVMYNPDAIVYHKVSESKVKVKALLRRAFYQGYSKAWLGRHSVSGDSIATERSYLKTLLVKSIPRRMGRIYDLTELKKLLFIMASISSVGLGFLYGYIGERIAGWRRR